MSRINMLESIVAIARKAGAAIMDLYATDFSVRSKSDASPVTAADERAEAVILAGIAGLTPEWPVVAEEAITGGPMPPVDAGRFFWLVDPLDGTREFVSRNGEFTVNIALVENGRPVLGVVFAPALQVPGASTAAGGRLWAGAEAHGAWVEDQEGKRPIRCRAPPGEGLTVVTSRSHGDRAAQSRLLSGQTVARWIEAGSSLKLCLVAEGLADVYPRLGRTMEWDIAAGHAVLMAAGGSVTCIDNGAPLHYGKPGFENPHFVAIGYGA